MDWHILGRIKFVVYDIDVDLVLDLHFVNLECRFLNFLNFFSDYLNYLNSSEYDKFDLHFMHINILDFFKDFVFNDNDDLFNNFLNSDLI